MFKKLAAVTVAAVLAYGLVGSNSAPQDIVSEEFLNLAQMEFFKGKTLSATKGAVDASCVSIKGVSDCQDGLSCGIFINMGGDSVEKA